MPYTQGLFPIVQKKNLAKNIFDLTILCPEIAKEASAGQFAHVKATGFQLRRPISICGIDPEAGTIRLVFEIRGDGTEAIARLNQGVTLCSILFRLAGTYQAGSYAAAHPFFQRNLAENSLFLCHTGHCLEHRHGATGTDDIRCFMGQQFF